LRDKGKDPNKPAIVFRATLRKEGRKGKNYNSQKKERKKASTPWIWSDSKGKKTQKGKGERNGKRPFASSRRGGKGWTKEKSGLSISSSRRALDRASGEVNRHAAKYKNNKKVLLKYKRSIFSTSWIGRRHSDRSSRNEKKKRQEPGKGVHQEQALMSSYPFLNSGRNLKGRDKS